jgi:hypothetical protein
MSRSMCFGMAITNWSYKQDWIKRRFSSGNIFCYGSEPFLYLSPTSVDIATRLSVAKPRFDPRQGQEILLISTSSRQTLGPIQPPIQWVLWSPTPGVKPQSSEADHFTASSAEDKNGGDIPPSPTFSHHVILNGIFKYGDNFYKFTLCFSNIKPKFEVYNISLNILPVLSCRYVTFFNGSSSPFRLRPIIQLLNHFFTTVGLLGRVISPSQDRYVDTGQHKHRINAYTHQISMPW